MDRKRLTYGMVGGDLDAFIGSVHRSAINYDGRVMLVAGCFSTVESDNIECAEFYRLEQSRTYSNYKEMAEKESLRDDKIDFVSIVTPNFLHYEICKEFIQKGINVVCEKPLCFEVEQAQELEALAKENDVFFTITYGYSGYPMVKQAKKLIADGVIGDIINVNAEYLQEWLVDDVSSTDEKMTKLSLWRKNPALAGISNCVGDIGTHIEHTISYMTGLKLKRLIAKLDYFGQPLDLNANILVEYEGGIGGVYSSSQVCVGHANGLVTRIFGTKGAIEWQQEYPNDLKVTLKGEPVQLYTRGMGYISGRAATLSRIPSGHPEGLYEAFANIYKTYISAILKKINHEELTKEDLDFPSVSEGVDGVRFIHAAVASNSAGSIWMDV